MRRLTCLLALSCGLLAAMPGTARADLVYTFLSCGLNQSCPTTTTIASFSIAGTTPITAPAAPAGVSGSVVFSSPVTLATTPLAGTWSTLGIYSFNFDNGSLIGSNFYIGALSAANGQSYGTLATIGPYQTSAARLTWPEGTYGGLGIVTCLNANCTLQSTILAFVTLTVTNATTSVPEPAGLGLLGIGLTALVARRRRKA